MKFRFTPALLLLALSFGANVSPAAESLSSSSPAEAHKALQKKIDDAVENSIVDFELTKPVTLEAPLVVNKPVWLRGLRLQLPPKLPRTQLVKIESPGVQLTDSFFRGNGDTVDQGERASLVEIYAGEFRVERCTFENSAKNGLTIDPGNSGKSIIGGVVRDIIGRHVIRDVVSLSGGPNGAYVQDVLIENVRASDSSMRGAVEVSDGSRDITVRSITAERCVYAVDFQDHDDPSDINHNVLIEDIRARNCRHAVRTATDLPGHTGLTIRDVLAENCDVPVRVSEIHDVIIEGVRIIGHKRDPTEEDDLQCFVQVKNCVNVVLRDISITDGGEIETAVRVIDTEKLAVDGLSVNGKTSLDNALLFLFRSDAFAKQADNSNLRRIVAPQARRGAVRTASDREKSISKTSDESKESTQTTGQETLGRTSADEPRQYAPQDAYLPGDPLPFYGSEDPWYRTKIPSPGGRMYHAQQVFDLIEKSTQKALADSQKWIDSQIDDSDEARFYHVVALAQAGELEAAEQELEELLDLGFPPERFLAGPRQLTQPLQRLAAFERRVASPSRGLVHGPLLGAVTTETANIWVRTAQAAQFEVIVYPAWGPDHPIATGRGKTTSSVDYTGVAKIENLAPDTQYHYRLKIDGQEVPRGTEWSFRTAPTDDSNSTVKVAFGGCADYTPTNERIWDTIRLHQPDAFLTLGDNVYIDMPGPVTAWHDQAYYRRQSRPEWRRLAASTPVYAIWDDHDVAVDDVFLGPYVDRPSWKLDQFQLFRRQWNNPSYGAEPETPGVWFSFRRGKVEVFLLDGRYYRENYLRPNASMLGSVQKAWLLDALKKSTATFKVIASPVAWADDAKSAEAGGAAHDTWYGYQSERKEIFDFIKSHQIDGVLLLSSDRHRSDVRLNIPEDGYPLYEIASGRLANQGFHEPHGETLFVYTDKQSYGLLTFNFDGDGPIAKIEIVNIDGQSVFERDVPLSEISHSVAGVVN